MFGEIVSGRTARHERFTALQMGSGFRVTCPKRSHKISNSPIFTRNSGHVTLVPELWRGFNEAAWYSFCVGRAALLKKAKKI